MAHFKVWLATDAFLYLPIYALDELGILARVGQALGINGCSIEIAASPKRGDKGAVEHMLAASNHIDPGGVVHIAVGDPVGAFNANPDGDKVRLLAALIKKPPFWVLGRDLHCNDELVHYGPEFATGFVLGKELNGSDGKPYATKSYKNLGDEVDLLFSSGDRAAKIHVLTADIIGMVRATLKDTTIQTVNSLRRDPKFHDLITTVMTTNKVYVKRRANELAVFIEAVRTACILLQTADRSTASLARRISSRPEFRDQIAVLKTEQAGEVPCALDHDEAEELAAQIVQDDLFGESLSISAQEWQTTLEKHQSNAEERAKVKAFFARTYEPDLSDRKVVDWLNYSMKDYAKFPARLGGVKRIVSIALAASLISIASLPFTNFSQSEPNVVANFIFAIIYGVIVCTIIFGSALLILSEYWAKLPGLRWVRYDANMRAGVLLSISLIVAGCGAYVAGILTGNPDAVEFIKYFIGLVVSSVSVFLALQRLS